MAQSRIQLFVIFDFVLAEFSYSQLRPFRTWQFATLCTHDDDDDGEQLFRLSIVAASTYYSASARPNVIQQKEIEKKKMKIIMTKWMRPIETGLIDERTEHSGETIEQFSWWWNKFINYSIFVCMPFCSTMRVRSRTAFSRSVRLVWIYFEHHIGAGSGCCYMYAELQPNLLSPFVVCW